MTLFNRDWKLIVDVGEANKALDVSALDIEFKVLRSIKPTTVIPNKASVTVWNMRQDHRAQILKRNRPQGAQGSKIVGVPVQIEAGYKDQRSVIFSGDMREVTSTRDGSDWKTTLAGDDGGRSYRESTIDTTFTSGTTFATIVKQCASAMGIGFGNLFDFANEFTVEGLGASIPHTMTLDGNARVHLDRIIRSCGFTWSIQSGALQILRKGKPLNQQAILLGPNTGLLGSPEASIDSSVSIGNPQQFNPNQKQTVVKPKQPKDPSIIRFNTLMIPGLVPGRKLLFETREFKGGYMLTEVEYVGQTWSSTWGCNCVARAYQ